MKTFLMGLLFIAIAVPTAPVMARNDRGESKSHREKDNRAKENPHHSNRGRYRGQQHRVAWQDYKRYDYNRYDPRYGNYQANRYYRDGSYYRDRRLSDQDRIYRGFNNRYHCRRNDGTTGLIIGTAGGSLLGRVIAPNGSKTLGTILGGAGGAVIGHSIGRNGVQCN